MIFMRISFEFSLVFLMVVVQCISCDFQGHGFRNEFLLLVSCVTRLHPYCTIVLMQQL